MSAVYINNAATAWPRVPGLAQVLGQNVDSVPLHPGRTGFAAPDPEEACRSLLAELLGVTHPERILLTGNATHALNIALHGYPWGQGAKVVVTKAEHNAVLRPLYYLEKHQGLELIFVDVDESGRVDAKKWQETLQTQQPRLAIFTHASNVTGAVNDAALLCKLARELGIPTLVDASQSMGCIDVKPQEWGADMLAFTGHKYLLGPLGTGGLYIGEGIELEPVWVGGTGILSELKEMPPHLPIRFDIGTPNSTAFAGLAHALAWSKENPIDLASINQKAEYLASEIAKAGAYVVPWQGAHTPVLSFNPQSVLVEEMGEILQLSFDIICRTGLHCAPLVHQSFGCAEQGTVRFSLSRFTTDEEVETVLQAVRSILA